MILLKQMIVFFLLIITGAFCRKRGYLNDISSKSLSALIVNITNPFMIIASAINAERINDSRVLLYALFTAFAAHAFLVAASIFVPKLLKAEKKDYGIYRVMTIFTNLGFLGMPVVRSVYGDIAVLYAAIFTVPFNVLIYTYGISAIKGETFKFEGGRDTIKKILNIGIIATVLGVTLYLGEISLPSFLTQTINYLGDLTAPLTMLVIGDSIATMDIKGLLRDKKLIAFSGIKLILVPLAGMALLSLIPLDPVLKGTTMILMAMPVASMTAMLANQYGSNTELASKGVALTTLLSIVTMPGIQLLAGVLFK